MTAQVRRLVVLLVLGAMALAMSAAISTAASASTAAPTVDDESGFWPFDGDSGTTATDYSGFGANATLHGPAAFTKSSIPALDVGNDQALALPSGGYATATVPAPLASTSEMTIAAWVKTTSPNSSSGNIISIDGKAALSLDGNVFNDPYFMTAYVDSSFIVSRGISAYTTNSAWHHLVFTYGAAGITAYVDGVHVNDLPGVYPLKPGTGITFGDPGGQFSGAIDDVRIYNRELTPTEVNRLAFNCGDITGGTNVVTGVSTSECHGLADFYLATNGASWTNSSGWLQSRDACSWQGVLCNDGHVLALVLQSKNLRGTLPVLAFNSFSHVVSLGLSGNHLSGAIPLLSPMTALQALDLSNNAFSGNFPVAFAPGSPLQSLNLGRNALVGDVSRTVLQLSHLINLNVQYNGLDPTDADVRAFFAAHEADWSATQTVAPTGLHATGTTATTVTLAWTPIAYTGDGGYYEVLAVDPDTNAITSVGKTADKTAAGLTVSGLSAGQPYTLEVRTVTPPHDTQANTVTSEPGASISVTPAAPTMTVQDSSPAVTWNSWIGLNDPDANGGTLRISPKAGATATFHFTGKSVTWLARTGPDRGRATVLIDGKNKSTFDLYATASSNKAFVYGGLANRAHTVTIKVLGTKRAASDGSLVTVDGFRVGSSATVVQDDSRLVTYDSWSATVRMAASGGTFRSTGLAGRTSSLSFTGTGVAWITARGPAYGKASVAVDGGPATTVDLYRSSTSWRAVGKSITGLPPGPHTIVIRVLGSKNRMSHGFQVPVDAFIVTG